MTGTRRPGIMSKAVWPQRRVEQMLALNAQGHPPRVIVKLLNADESLPKVSRSAVIGKLRRLGPGVRGPEKPVPKRSQAPKPVTKKPRPDEPYTATGAERGEWNVRFLERAPSMCPRFVEGEEGSTGLVCGRVVSTGSAWCAHCARVLFVKNQAA